MLPWLRRIPKFAEEYILENWKYKLIALFAAVIIWAYVAGQQTVRVIFNVPIRFQNIPAGSQVSDQKVRTAEVALSGRRDRILTLKRQDVWVSLDLSGLRNGRNLYLISSRDVIVPAGIEVKDVSPRQLNLQLSPQAEAAPQP